ncbi:hypothetical protein ILYODFUR_003011 [Ilyodon furcidens]|uniref:Uncharacterized protein n=1 Tax=Ilyodon furcidens TaxID=33524 RepID=A0ABV0UCW8_9TELE
MCPNPHHVQEVHVLMDIFCQSFAVMVPGQGVHFLNDLSGSDPLYYCVVDDKCVSGLGLPEIHNLISLAFANLQDKVAGFAPVHQVFYLLPLEGVIVITDKANYCYVIHKLHKVACSGPGTAVMCQQGEQERTQDVSSRGSGAGKGDNGKVLVHSHRLIGLLVVFTLVF